MLALSHLLVISDAEALEYSLIENLQRKDVDPIDVAQGLRKLYENFQVTWKFEEKKTHKKPTINEFAEWISPRVGLSSEQIRQYLSLLGLTPELQEMVSEGKLRKLYESLKSLQTSKRTHKKFTINDFVLVFVTFKSYLTETISFWCIIKMKLSLGNL